MVVSQMALGATPPRQIGVSSRDRFLLCAAEVFGKPVMAGWLSAVPACPSPKEALIETLKQNNVAVFDAGPCMFLAPIRFYVNGSQYELARWKRLVVRPHTDRWEVPNSRALSSEEQLAIANTILRHSRTVPVFVSRHLDQGIPGERPARPDEETTVLEVFITIDAHRIGESKVESVAAVVTGGAYGSESRLSYGEIRDGRFELVWDSPLFWGWRLGFGWNDVDGDGIDEMLLWSEYGNASSPVKFLSILTRDGIELSRQDECFPADRDPYWEKDGSLCPIAGDRMELVPGSGRAKDIIVDGALGEQVPKRHRYRLINGRYRSVR